MKTLNFRYMDFVDVDIKLRQNKTVINGDSATGKSYLYNVIEQYSQEQPNSDENIICLDVDNVDMNYIKHTLEKLRSLKDAIIVIDQADDILINDELYDFIISDKNNYYIIMSRKYYNKYSELAYIDISNNSIKLQYKLNTL